MTAKRAKKASARKRAAGTAKKQASAKKAATARAGTTKKASAKKASAKRTSVKKAAVKKAAAPRAAKKSTGTSGSRKKASKSAPAKAAATKRAATITPTVEKRSASRTAAGGRRPAVDVAPPDAARVLEVRARIEPQPVAAVTKATGGRATAVGLLQVPPERQLGADEAESFALDSGLAGPALADVLSAFLAHERDGVHLYRTVAAATTIPAHRGHFEEFGAETTEHVAIYERLIVELGGDSGYVSPAARMRCAQNGKLLEALLLSGSADADAYEVALVEAVVVAETACHANWRFLQDLAAEMTESPARTTIEQAVTEVMHREDEHLDWAQAARDNLLVSALTAT